jgi:outer membrane immunogenic protein
MGRRGCVMKIGWIGAAATVLFAGSAIAADLPARPAAPAPYVANWTGCYIGGNGGAVMAEKDWVDATPGSPTFGETYGNNSPYAAILGVQGGCDIQFGSFVVGIQGDYAWSDAHDGHRNRLIGTWRHVSKVDGLGTATVRVGYAFDRFLGYIKGGVAWESDKREIYQVGTEQLIGSTSQTRTGYTFGFGGEIMVFQNISAFVEANYFNYGSSRNDFQLQTGGTVPIDIKDNAMVARAGLNWRFGGGPVMAKY